MYRLLGFPDALTFSFQLTMRFLTNFYTLLDYRVVYSVYNPFTIWQIRCWTVRLITWIHLTGGCRHELSISNIPPPFGISIIIDFMISHPLFRCNLEKELAHVAEGL